MKNKVLAGVLAGLLLNMLSIPVYADGLENFNWSNQAIEFSDVQKDSWYYSSVSQVSACGIINGVGNNQFKPGGILTHAEAMTLMAKTHAIYYGKLNELAEAQASSQGSHWATNIVSFCKDNSLPFPSEEELDLPITRGTMADYFYDSIPRLAFNTGISNNTDDMPEDTTNETIRHLFKAGIMVGDNSGFRLQDSITRAEAAAIIQRVANPDARVKISEKPENQVMAGETQEDKPYKRIPNTKWSIDPTFSVTIQSQTGRINTKYGNHSYGSRDQKEYDKVMSVIDEAFEYACKEEKNRTYSASLEKKLAPSESEVVKFFKNEIGITSTREIVNIVITEGIVQSMQNYLSDTYANPNGAGTNKDYHNNNVYKYLFEGGFLDCDGNGYLNMLCWDYLGFSTRMITSMKIAHATSQVYVNGHWIMVNQNGGSFDFCTHEQLLELIYGIKNDAYSIHNDTDAMIKSASEAIDSGNISQRPDDLEIWSNETPTHAPYDSSVI